MQSKNIYIPIEAEKEVERELAEVRKDNSLIAAKPRAKTPNSPLLLAISVILFFAGFYILVNSYSENYRGVPSETLIPKPTPANILQVNIWKTYKNNNLGVTFKYPPSWFTYSETSESIVLSTTDPDDGGNLETFEITKHDNPDLLDSLEWWKKNTNQSLLSDYMRELEENYLEKVQIAGKSAIKILPDSAPENLETTEYYIKAGDRIYKIKLTFNIDNDFNEELSAELIKSFKITY